MSKHENVAIVFGGGINALGIIRNLGQYGIDVYCVLENKDEALFSKYCRKRFIIPNIQNDTRILKSFLHRLRSSLKHQAVIYSTTDLFSLNLARLKEEIKDDFHLVLPDLAVVETLVNKKSFHHSLSNFNVPCPKTYFPDSLESAKRIAKKMSYPVFIKPAISQIFFSKYKRKGFEANSPEEVAYYFNLAYRDKIDVMIQEIIPGPDSKIFDITGYFGKKDSNFFAYNRLRAWPIGFGNSSLIESVPLANVSLLTQTVKSYLEKLNYFGLMEAEFKFDPHDEKFKLIEINARSWWQNYFPAKCGLNLVLIAYLDALDFRTRIDCNYDVGKKWLHFPSDVLSVTRSKEMTFGSWLSSLKGINDYAYFSVKDPAPWVASYLFKGRAFFRS